MTTTTLYVRTYTQGGCGGGGGGEKPIFGIGAEIRGGGGSKGPILIAAAAIASWEKKPGKFHLAIRKYVEMYDGVKKKIPISMKRSLFFLSGTQCSIPDIEYPCSAVLQSVYVCMVCLVGKRCVVGTRRMISPLRRSNIFERTIHNST